MFAFLPGYVEVGDGADCARAESKDQQAALPGAGDHGQSIGGMRGQIEDKDFCLDRAWVEDDAAAARQPFSDQACIGVIVSQPLEVVVESVKAGCGEETDLPHGTAEHPSVANTAPDDLGRPGQQGASRSTKPFRERHIAACSS